LLERIARLRHALDAPAFTTDVIVGFPGETGADFAATCRVVREAGFSRVHVFSYSPRAGTAAAALRDDVPPRVKAERREALLALERELAEAYYRSLVGRVLDVLVEGGAAPPGCVKGTSCRYAPVVFRGLREALLRQRVPVRAVGVGDGVIVGEPVPEVGLAPTDGPARTARLALPVVR
jgi:threonylcarbamoyladenosine tRNA methylthiotransferase MtaB